MWQKRLLEFCHKSHVSLKKEGENIRHILLNVSEEIKHILPDTLRKDLQDNEELCPACHGIGVKLWNNPYGIKGDTSEVAKESTFPYNHQSLLPCPNCYNGVVNICKYCGKQLPKGRLKCNCEQQKVIDEKENRIKYQETIENAKEVDIKSVSTYLYDQQTDHYFAEIEDFVEEYKDNADFESDEKMLNNLPEVLWVCSEADISIDADSIIENACDNLHEDALDVISYEDRQELQEFLDKWCEKQSGTRTYYPCYKEYVRVQKEWFD